MVLQPQQVMQKGMSMAGILGMDRKPSVARAAWALLAVAVFTLLLVGHAFAKEQGAEWWDKKWKFRRLITVDMTSVGLGGEVSDAPLLVRLHTGNFDFAAAKPKGEDLRFVSQDGKTVLEHRIEGYEQADNLAFIWVKLPRVSTGQQQIWVYYGNDQAPAIPDTGKVYDPGYLAVYNFNEAEGAPQDATAYKNTFKSFSVGQGFAGVIGKSVSFNGASDRLVLNAAPSLDFSKGLTMSAWVNLPQAQTDGVLLAVGDNGALTVGVRQTSLYVQAVLPDGTQLTSNFPADLELGQWKHVTVVMTPAKSVAVFLDGTKAGELTLPVATASLKGDVSIGASAKGDRFLGMALDEFELSGIPRPDVSVKYAAAIQGPKEGLVTVGEAMGGQELGILGQYLLYLGVVIQNTSLDGWVIVGILAIMGIWSAVVAVGKYMYLVQNERITKEFLDDFDELQPEELMSLADEEDEYINSSIFNVYALACKELKNRQASPRESIRYRKALSAMEKVMEVGFVGETKQLNANLVILTLSVAGAPFMGLLGTVYGVMNTFAGLTLAGEANLAAIAPGMASALICTIFGLLVAVPALFAYNLLFLRVRALTIEMNAFMERFKQLAEEYWEEA